MQWMVFNAVIGSDGSNRLTLVPPETFVRIRAAHEVLSDPIAKQSYDRFGPTSVTCTTCKTVRDHVVRGLSSYYTFYLSTGVILVLMSVLGKGQFGRYWRFIVLFGMAALELAMVTRSEPVWLLSWIMPHRVTFEQIAILHQIFVSTFIAISQIGPILVPSKEQEKTNVKDLVHRLELLTAMSSKLCLACSCYSILFGHVIQLIFLGTYHQLDGESIDELQKAFDVFRGDEESMTLLKNQMGKMALDSRLMQDKLLNEARNAAHVRLVQRKNT